MNSKQNSFYEGHPLFYTSQLLLLLSFIYFFLIFVSIILITFSFIFTREFISRTPPPLRGVFLIPKPNSFETLFNLFFFMSSV